jgi:hypothetical protein
MMPIRYCDMPAMRYSRDASHCQGCDAGCMCVTGVASWPFEWHSVAPGSRSGYPRTLRQQKLINDTAPRHLSTGMLYDVRTPFY